MKQWWKDGERLILCLDANENIYRGELGRRLTKLDGLGMKEVVGGFTVRQLGATYFRGSEPIDGVWATGDITMTNACVMPVGFGVGDHRLFDVDFATTTLVGSGTTTVVRPVLRDSTQRYTAAMIGTTNSFIGISSVTGSWNEWWLRLHRALPKLISLRR